MADKRAFEIRIADVLKPCRRCRRRTRIDGLQHMKECRIGGLRRILDDEEKYWSVLSP